MAQKGALAAAQKGALAAARRGAFGMAYQTTVLESAGAGRQSSHTHPLAVAVVAARSPKLGVVAGASVAPVLAVAQRVLGGQVAAAVAVAAVAAALEGRVAGAARHGPRWWAQGDSAHPRRDVASGCSGVALHTALSAAAVAVGGLHETSPNSRHTCRLRCVAPSLHVASLRLSVALVSFPPNRRLG